YPHRLIEIGRVSEFLRLAREAKCTDIVLIGTVLRPNPLRMRIDWGMVKLLPRLLAVFRGGDNHLLTGVGQLFEQHGFRLLGAHEVAPEILVPEGTLARHVPSPQDSADIAL